MADLSVNVSDNLAFSENVTALITELFISGSDTIAISETLERSSVPIIYSINAGSQIHGVQSNWKRVPTRQNVDGTISLNNWAINTWNLPIVGLTNFETLRAAQGTLLTSLETNDIDNINGGKAYSTAILEGVVNGQHQGIQMLEVTITFRVDTTS